MASSKRSSHALVTRGGIAFSNLLAPIEQLVLIMKGKLEAADLAACVTEVERTVAHSVDVYCEFAESKKDVRSNHRRALRMEMDLESLSLSAAVSPNTLCSGLGDLANLRLQLHPCTGPLIAGRGHDRRRRAEDKRHHEGQFAVVRRRS